MALRQQLKVLADRFPPARRAAGAANRAAGRLAFRGSAGYWERRYRNGGTSGPGSKGPLAQFKAEVLNDLVRSEGVVTVVEFGCGDGGQLTLADYPCYTGLDVAASAVARCMERFRTDPAKSFFLYDPRYFVDRAGLFRADLALSLDVVIHLVEDDVFELHLRLLFASGRRLVVIYSSDFDGPGMAAHVRHRDVSGWVARHQPGWRLTARVPNRYPYAGEAAVGTQAEFMVFRPVEDVQNPAGGASRARW